MKNIYDKRWLSGILFLLLLLMAALRFGGADAAAASVGKPSIDAHSAYLNDRIFLKWSKTKGAKKYEIQRAAINKDGSPGAWETWVVTTKTHIKKTGSGDYIYRVRGINGKKQGKWSDPRRIFGASAVITDFIYEPVEYSLNKPWHRENVYAHILVSNKTVTDMEFPVNESFFGAQGTLYAIDPATQKTVGKWDARLYMAGTEGTAKIVKAGKQQSIYAEIDITGKEYEAYKNYNFLFTSSFYLNSQNESMASQMAFACTKSLSDSSVASKKLVEK